MTYILDDTGKKKQQNQYRNNVLVGYKLKIQKPKKWLDLVLFLQKSECNDQRKTVLLLHWDTLASRHSALTITGHKTKRPLLGTGPQQGQAAGGGRARWWDDEPTLGCRLCLSGRLWKLPAAIKSPVRTAPFIPAWWSSFPALVQECQCWSLLPGSRWKPMGGVCFLPGASKG